MRKTAPLKNIIDIEASGLSSLSYPIEIGIVLDNGEQYQSLIKPLTDWTHWDHGAEQLHGISQKELKQRGRAVETVCKEVNEFCSGRTLYSDCWVHDSTWLNLLFWRAGVRKTFECSPFESLLNDDYLHNYAETKLAVEAMNNSVTHRALEDALTIQQAVFLLENKLGSGRGLLGRTFSESNDERLALVTAN